MTLEIRERQALARRLLADREPVAATAADRVLGRHPEWEDRHGELARERGRETMEAQIDYLAGAVIAGERRAFEDHVRWTRRVLSARGVPAAFIADTLGTLGGVLVRHLGRAGEPGERVELVDQLVHAGLAALDVGPNGAHEARAEGEDAGFRVERSFYLQAARSDQRDTALEVALGALDSGASVTDVYGRILAPAQDTIGRLWEQNEITVSQEHSATAVTEFVLERLHPYLDTPRPRRGPAVVTAVPGEQHVIGARMVAHALEADGWGVHFLGEDDHDAILAAVRDTGAALVAVSATVLFNLPAAARLLIGIRDAFGNAPAVIAGGAAFSAGDGLWRELDADGVGRTPQEAVTLADSLAGP